MHLPALLGSFGKFSFAHFDHLAPSFLLSHVYGAILLLWRRLRKCEQRSEGTRREQVRAGLNLPLTALVRQPEDVCL